MKCNSFISKLLVVFVILLLFSCTNSFKPEWPDITYQNKPWTRWWWMGSAVDSANLSAALEEYTRAGLGGVEITPIYGVKGHEEDYIDYLSPEWVQMLVYTLKEAKRLGIGVDMANGTGWPFGGPWIRSEDACKYMAYKEYEITGGQSLTEPIRYVQSAINRTIGRKVDLASLKRPVASNDSLQQIAYEQIRFEMRLPLIVLMAYEARGDIMELTDRVNDEGILDWVAPEGNWKLFAVFQGPHGKLVERAAPGGEGDIIDHFSKDALQHYLNRFDEAFGSADIKSLRGFFNDSYEVDDAIGEADFTPKLFDEFKIRRGYDLRNHIPALFGTDTLEEKHIRILNDYRLTISELLLDNFTIPWHEWAKKYGAIVRNQAHGSPANILDLYAAADIPETEGDDQLRIRFASSAGNFKGKSLISSETATWLNEHFQASLSQVKTRVDEYFLGGVNHIVYHGTAYSPKEEDWPGWMFYASVHFAPTNSFWKDFSALNHYITRCQSLLQEGKPDNDILLYFPFHDRISVPGRSLLEHFSGGGPRGEHTSFRRLAEELISKGFSVDYVSDRQIAEIKVSGSELLTPGGSYKAILLPQVKYIPIETMVNLAEMAESGAQILFYGRLPEDISGYANYSEKKKIFDILIAGIEFSDPDESGVRTAKNGKGLMTMADQLKSLLDKAGIEREEMVDQGIKFLRKKSEFGEIYFIVNQGKDRFDGYIPVNKAGSFTAIFNPSTDQIGWGQTGDGEDKKLVYIQLEPGETCFLRTYPNKTSGDTYPYLGRRSEPVVLDDSWELILVSGGPIIPEKRQLDSLDYWTRIEEDPYKYFSGTARYSSFFDKPDMKTYQWILNLGDVKESATVYLNGDKIATLFFPPFQTLITPDLLQENDNILEIEVSNLMANRIIYMDREGMEYRNFYNVNFPARKPENKGKDGLFTAIRWEPLPSGLRGPVTLIPVGLMEFR